MIFLHEISEYHGNCAKSWVDLQGNPKAGASWEGFAFEEVIKAVKPDQHYFWRTHNGAELDLMMIKRLGTSKNLGRACRFKKVPLA